MLQSNDVAFVSKRATVRASGNVATIFYCCSIRTLQQQNFAAKVWSICLYVWVKILTRSDNRFSPSVWCILCLHLPLRRWIRDASGIRETVAPQEIGKWKCFLELHHFGILCINFEIWCKILLSFFQGKNPGSRLHVVLCFSLFFSYLSMGGLWHNRSQKVGRYSNLSPLSLGYPIPGVTNC